MRARDLLAALLAIVCLAPLAGAQLHKDTRLGFQFKPPKKFVALAIEPGETIVVAKYQSEQREHGSTYGNQANPSFGVSFYPNALIDVERSTYVERLWERVETALGYCNVEKSKEARIGKDSCLEKHLRPENGGQTYYVAVLDQDEGVFVFTGSVISERFSKYASDFSKAAKSFKRIDQDDHSERDAELEQMSEQERFLQTQIDKLPPGWEHLRTERYLFLFDADKAWVKGLAEQIEAMRDVYQVVYPLDEPITAVSIVRVCKSRDEYLGYGGREGTGGYWNPGQRELVFFDAPPRVDNESVLNHEAFHQYIYYFYGELSPHSWYNEGTGDYFSGARLTRSYRIKEFYTAPGGYNRLPSVKEGCRLLAEGHTENPRCATPLKDLLHFSQAEYYSRGGVHYPQGWALIHMLRESKRLEPKWERILDDYLVNLLEAREEVAVQTRDRAMEQAEKKEPGSAAELPQEPEEWYGRADTDEIQDLAYAKTFAEWNQDDWDRFQQAYLDYVEKL